MYITDVRNRELFLFVNVNSLSLSLYLFIKKFIKISKIALQMKQFLFLIVQIFKKTKTVFSSHIKSIKLLNSILNHCHILESHNYNPKINKLL